MFALIAAALALALVPAPAAAAADGVQRYSKLWGKVGEAWDPAGGRLFDFSFAGECSPG